MSGAVLPNITYSAIDKPLYGQGGGSVVGSTINTSSISTVFLDVRSGNVGLGGGEYISTIGKQLYFFNGTVLEPISALSSLSSIAEWSLEPAISAVDMAGEDIVNGNIIEAALVSTMTVDTDFISAQQAFVSDLRAFNIVAENFTALSTIQTYNYVSSLIVEADAIETSTLNGYTIQQLVSPSTFITSTLVANTLVSTPEAFISSINGLAIASFIASDTSNWAKFPANATVNMASNNLNQVQLVNGEQIFITGDKAFDVTGPGKLTLTGANGSQGQVIINAEPGASGQSLGGVVAITAQGGTFGPITFGGSISLDANTGGIGDYGSATSKISMSAAGINSYAGAIPPIASLAGYQFIFGNAGVNICAGIPSIIPNIPLTSYIYGTAGVGLEAGIGAEVEVKNSDFATLAIKPRTSVLVNFGDLVISGRDNIVQPSQYVQMSNVKRIDFEVGQLAAINNLSTINGQPVDAFINTPAISTFNQVFTSSLNASTISTGDMTVTGAITIPATTSFSGVLLPLNPIYGAGIFAMGLSTSTNFLESWTGLTTGSGMPFNEGGQEMMCLIKTENSNATFESADISLGRALFCGPGNFGADPTGYISGDTLGNLYAGANKFETSTIHCSTLNFPSTILKGDLTGSVLSVLESANPANYGQVEAQAYTMAATVGGSNGTLYYRDLEDRAGFLDNNGIAHTLAYTNDSNIGVNTLEVSTINMNGTGTINWDGGVSMYETAPNSFFITNGAGYTMDISPTLGFGFTEAASGTVMAFDNGHLTVNNISTLNLQAFTSMLTSSLTVSTINNLPPLLDGSVGNLSSFGVSSIVAGFADVDNLFVQNIASSDPLASGISGFSSLQVKSGSISTLQVSTINSQPYLGFRGGQFYRSVNQNLPTGNNTLIFDSLKSWNSTDFIQTDPSTFLCSTTGTYQIGLNTTVLAGSGTWTNLLKSLIISQDRSGSQSVVINSTSVPSPFNYGQSASAVIDIDQGDNLRFITGQTLTIGSTISLGLTSVFDYNTFWDYQLLRTG